MATDTIINNLNSVIGTKNEIAGIIRENGINPGTTFSDYPGMLRTIIGSGGGSGIADSYFNAYNFVYVNNISGTLPDTPTPVRIGNGDLVYVNDENWPYVGANIFTPGGDYSGHEFVGVGTLNNWLENYVPSGSLDLSSYVTKTELSAQSYITEAVFNNGTGGFITDIQNSTSGGKHILLYNRGQAITPSALASMGYITSSDVSAMGYITAAAIDNNLIPKENNTYTLGDSTYLYAATYTSNLWLNSKNRFNNKNNNQINVQLNDSWRYTFHVNNFGPAADNIRDLGESSIRWKSTYTANIYADNAYISNYNNLIWTGTSAQYAALSDYTTYQIYLIQEA